ncbi:hypothetical protein ASPCADRAFT_502697 [Aspergillus carbonarius ITEM 5010]|uniref:Protein kinase domain-containing protein n=1 Tax=Aspergillus carbonarius (strain ITEM 5010) TaxID=602072 RepID=A0A1R3S0V2_ASPC5|nr:hypothetical protein ASPCADRAFT_502697 [Aspergillus carbonarius ITEM 5010]
MPILRLPSRLPRFFFTWHSWIQQPASAVRELSQSFPLLDPTEKLEEEALPWQHTYATLKVFERNSADSQRETEAYDHLNSLRIVDHAGAKLIRKALDSFRIASPDGNTFGCLVHPPLGMSLYEFRTQLRAKVLPEKIVKLTLVHLLLALDYLHTEAGIVHTAHEKIVNDRVIYASRKLKKTKRHGRPTLCDFGQARFGSDTYSGDIQPYIYRAPEVVLRMPWNEKTWDFFQQGHLFYARDADKTPSDGHHIAEMIAVMGLPPREMTRSAYANEFFDGEGNWKADIKIPLESLEKLEGALEGESQQLFLRFLRKMLRWKSEERASARELLDDPWLRSA